MVEMNAVTAMAAMMIKDGRIAELEEELREQRTLLVWHAGALNNRIKELMREVDLAAVEIERLKGR